MASYEFIQQDQNVSLKSTRQVNNNINVQKVILSTCIFSFKFNCTKIVSHIGFTNQYPPCRKKRLFSVSESEHSLYCEICTTQKLCM